MKLANKFLVIVFGGMLFLGTLVWEMAGEDPGLFAIAGIAIVGFVSLYFHMYRTLTVLSQAVSPLASKTNIEDMSDIEEVLGTTKQKLDLIAHYVRHLGTGKESLPTLLVDDQIGEALMAVQEEMKKSKEQEANQHWIAESIASFGEVLRNKAEAVQYSTQIIRTLAKYLGASQGGFYIYYDDKDLGQIMRLMGTYAYDQTKKEQNIIYPGEGLLGQCMHDKQMIFLKNIPEDYFKISSGSGEAVPRNVVIVPLVANERFFGAIEIASFQLLQPFQLEFLTRVSLNIASEMASLKTFEDTQRLLLASDELREELQANEEELKQNLEELSTTQEEMHRKQKALEQKQVELNSYLNAIDNTVASVQYDMEGGVLLANEIFCAISGYSKDNVKFRRFEELVPNDEAMRLMWQNLREGKFFSGEFKLKNNKGGEEIMIGTFNPILDVHGVPERVVMIAQFVTQDREKTNDLHAMVHAFKSSLPVVEFNENLQCKTGNEKFLKLMGISRLSLKSLHIGDFLSEEHYNSELGALSCELMTKDNTLLTIPVKIGEMRAEFYASLCILKNLKGEINRIVLVLIYEMDDAGNRLTEVEYVNRSLRPRG